MLTAIRTAATRRFALFGKDRRGVSAVEFALILPLLITIYFGSVELSRALTAYRKVNHLGAVVGDLVAQSSDLTAVEMNNIFDAGSAVMTPFNSALSRMVVGFISIDDKGKPKVVWSAARNRSPYTINLPPPVALPAGLSTPNSTLVLTQAEFTYLTTFAPVIYDFFGKESVLFKATSYFRPRGNLPIGYAN